MLALDLPVFPIIAEMLYILCVATGTSALRTTLVCFHTCFSAINNYFT